MSDIFNPIGRTLPGVAGPTLVTGVISDPPRGLIGLTPGTILKGTVLGRGPDGLTQVATDKGTVNVATSAQLPAGSTVTLEVRNAGDRLQVLILAVEGQNLRNQHQSTPASGTTTSASGGSGSTSATAPSSSGATRGATTDTTTQPSPKPASPPPIEVVGTSVKAIVVQAPAATALLPEPIAEPEAFVPPPTATPIPTDAAAKAQILVQTQQSLATAIAESFPDLPTGATTSAAPVAGQATPPLSAAGVEAAVLSGNILPSVGTTLQPEIAARIAALFAEANAETGKGTTGSPGATPGTSPGGASPAGAAPGTPAAPAIVISGNAAAGAINTNALHTNPLLAANLAAGPALAAAAANTAPVKVLAPGTELTLHVVAVLPTKGGTLEIAPDAARLTGATAPLLGRVLGYTRAGHPVIETPAGLVMMQQKTRLPVGAQVALVMEPTDPPNAVAVPAITTPQQAMLFLSRGWPTLDDLLAVLRGPTAAGAASESANVPPPPPGIPQTGPKLAAGLANAIAAFRSGEVEKLLGPLLASRKLGDGKDETVKRLKDEFTQLTELAKDRPAVDWRALFLPVYDERIGLTQINLYYRHGGGGDDPEEEKKGRGTRFLVEVNFAALGAFQLDGLIRGKRFDLMIRSRRRLGPDQRRDISGIFEQALELGGCKGGVEFRTVETFPVSPLDELRQSHDQFTA